PTRPSPQSNRDFSGTGILACPIFSYGPLSSLLLFPSLLPASGFSSPPSSARRLNLHNRPWRQSPRPLRCQYLFPSLDADLIPSRLAGFTSRKPVRRDFSPVA